MEIKIEDYALPQIKSNIIPKKDKADKNNTDNSRDNNNRNKNNSNTKNTVLPTQRKENNNDNDKEHGSDLKKSKYYC